MRASQLATSVLRRAQWVIMPLLVLGLAEGFVRLTADRVPTWYGAADRLLAGTLPVQALFIGSSRVEAAILPATFEQILAERGRPGITALNLGRGNSTDVEHYLGLRNLLAAHPDNLRGVTVFVEAPGGLAFSSRWESQWAMTEQPWMLVDLLRVSDLPAFWRSDGFDLETRLLMSVRVFLRRLALFNRRERVREQWLDEILPTLALGRMPNFEPKRILGDDLQGPGHTTSIRPDPAALVPARALAWRMGDEATRFQGPIREWHGTITEALVRLVRTAGGQVVFFEPPLSEAFLQVHRTKLRQEDAGIFASQAREWGACLVRPNFTYSDDDLPDLWHLRPERVSEYTRAVATAWLENCPGAR